MSSSAAVGEQQGIEQQNQQKYKVPAGLRPLLEAFARETLRTQPDDLVHFGLVFFNVLKQQRECKNLYKFRMEIIKCKNKLDWSILPQKCVNPFIPPPLFILQFKSIF
jgi:hypothetical protein